MEKQKLSKEKQRAIWRKASLKYLEKNREKQYERVKKYRELNKNKTREISKKWGEKNKEQSNKNTRNWRKKEYNSNEGFRKKLIINVLTRRDFEKELVCVLCGFTNYLQFHHWIYQLPIERKHFSTLCKYCHKAQHIKEVIL